MQRKEPVDVFQLYDMTGGPDACFQWRGAWGGSNYRNRTRRPYFMANGRRTMAYRWVWELVHGPIPEGMMVLHTCDNGGYPVGCGQPAHMYLGTNDDNIADKMKRGRWGLSHEVVNTIRKLLAEGHMQYDIAAQFDISRELVSAINTGRVYSHVPNPEDTTDVGGTG